jgi:hypothetical protein
VPSQPSPSTRRLLDFGAEHATHWLICAQVWSAQLNEAEYAPLLTAVLLYLNSEGVAAPLASTLAVGGQVIYFWLRAFVGHYHEGGMDPPPYAPFAVVRYIALGLLVQELRGLTA